MGTSWALDAARVDLPLEFNGYFARMTPMQIVWFSLAIVTAFKISATPGRRLDEMEEAVADNAARNNPILRGAPMNVAPRVFPPGTAPATAATAAPPAPSRAPTPQAAPPGHQKAA